MLDVSRILAEEITPSRSVDLETAADFFDPSSRAPLKNPEDDLPEAFRGGPVPGEIEKRLLTRDTRDA